MTKIVMLGHWPEGEAQNGVQAHNLGLYSELAKREGLEMNFLSFGKSSLGLVHKPDSVRILKTKQIDSRIPLVPLYRLRRELKRIDPDIVHLQGTNFSPYQLVALSMPRRIHLVVTCHGISSNELLATGFLRRRSVKLGMIRILEQLTFDRADTIISVDERKRALISRKFGESLSEKIAVVPNGVNLEEFDPARISQSDRMDIRSRHGISNDALMIFYAKPFFPFNGQQVIVEAMKHILSVRPDAWLVLAGAGPTMDQVKRTAKEIGVCDRVILLGEIKHSEIPNYLAACDISVVPSQPIFGIEEGSSIFLLESMAMGKPVVATAVGGNLESISNGTSGLLVGLSDALALGEAIAHLASEPERMKFMGNNARISVERRSWSRTADATLGIYLSLAGRKDH